MDYLDRLIEFANIKGEINVLCRFNGTWQLNHSQNRDLLGVFHIISKGQCCLRLEEQCYHLKEGDVFFLPYGSAHIIEKEVEAEPDPLRIDIQQEYGAFTLCANNHLVHDFEMFCGYFHYSSPLSRSFISLPQWYLSTENHSILSLLAILRQEATPALGGKAVVNALSNVLFTYLIRDYLAHHQVKEGILAALQDNRLSYAVNAMLEDPAQEWTMESLAERCAMSRATFIKQFKEKTGMLAGQFLTELRMPKAESLLKYSKKSIQQIAAEVGYSSEAHFSKTFKRYYRCSPSQFRS